MYSFGVSGWYGVGMSNWSVYKRVGICMYWGMSVSMSIWKSSIGYYWCLYAHAYAHAPVHAYAHSLVHTP